MTKLRKRYIETSNNPARPSRNVCANAAAEALGLRARYLHSISDLVRAARRSGYTVRSRASAARLQRGVTTVGQLRGRLAAIGARYYLVRVPGHVILLGANGQTLVDTDPRKRDRRRVTHLYGVWA